MGFDASAVVSIPSASARLTIEVMIAALRFPRMAAPRTKLRSILILSNGAFRGEPSEE